MNSIPDGWSELYLEDVATLQRGFDLPKAKRANGTIPIVSSGGVTDYNNEAKVTGPGVVTGRYGSIGDVFFIESDYWPLNTALWVKNFHSNDEKFVYYLLNRIDYNKFSDKTGVPGVNRNDLHKIKVKIPPLPEQKKIAEILSCWDKAIETTEKLIEAKANLKKGLGSKLLSGQFRFNNDETEWKTVEVGDVAKLTAGGTPSTRKSEYWGGNIPWMSSGEVHKKRVKDVEGRITERGFKNSSAKRIPKHSLLLALAGQGKTRETVAINEIELTTNQSIAAIIPDASKLNHEYLFHNLDARYEELRLMSTGQGRAGLNLKILRGITIPLPDINEQIEIAQLLNSCDMECNFLDDFRSLFVKQKKGLMQKLLTGRIRVKINSKQEVS